MRIRHLTPVELCIVRFKTLNEFAQAIGAAKSNVCRWQVGTTVGNRRTGSAGMIPAKYLKITLVKAKELGLDISAEDLILGKTICERD